MYLAREFRLLTFSEKAASGLEKLKMGDSPAKKIDFQSIDKENAKEDAVAPSPVVDDLALKKAHVDVVEKGQRPAVAPGIKEEEADEPLLQENPHRFVLFPIKYHEVQFLTRYAYSVSHNMVLKFFLGMANVQEGRSIFLDGRGGGLV